MCGVIGCFPTKRIMTDWHIEKFCELLTQSRIRGMHAYGIAAQFPSGRWSFLKSLEIAEVISWAFEISKTATAMIGHTRYDTSGNWRVAANNQPITIGQDFLVFNGVIRMSTKAEYEEEFGTRFTTENDGEILLWLLGKSEKGKAKKLLDDEQVSYAGIQVVNGDVSIYRNERRPLTLLRKRGLWVASTIDILARTFGAELNPQSIEPGIFHHVKT